MERFQCQGKPHYISQPRLFDTERPRRKLTKTETFSSWFRSFDRYGAPVQLRYNGSDSFQTSPGACFSIVSSILIAMVFIFKANILMTNGDWRLETQITAAPDSDLSQIINIGSEHPNVTIGVELARMKLAFNMTRQQYENYTDLITRYGEVWVLGFVQEGFKNSFTHDELTRRIGPGFEPFVPPLKFHFGHRNQPKEVNTYGNYEFGLDMDKLNIGGSLITPEPIEARFLAITASENEQQILEDAIEKCKHEEDCQEALVSFTEIFNFWTDMMSEEAETSERREELMQILHELSSNDFNRTDLIHNYYKIQAGKIGGEHKAKMTELKTALGVCQGQAAAYAKAGCPTFEAAQATCEANTGNMLLAYKASNDIEAYVKAMADCRVVNNEVRKCQGMKAAFTPCDEQAHTSQIEEQEAAFNKSSAVFNLLKHIQDIQNQVNEALYYISLVPVVYDEVEFFDGSDEASKYPFKPRKNIIPSLPSKIYDGPNQYKDPAHQSVYEIKLRKSLVCLDSDIWNELMFWKDDKCDFGDTDVFDYHKLQMGESQTVGENPIIPGVDGQTFWFFMVIGLDSQRKITIVKSYKVLEFLGDLGGFAEVSTVIFSIAGCYIASRMMWADVLSSNFKQRKKVNSPDLKGEFFQLNSSQTSSSEEVSVYELKPLRISSWYFLLKPLVDTFCFCRPSCRKRNRIAQRGEVAVNRKLEVSEMIMKIDKSFQYLALHAEKQDFAQFHPPFIDLTSSSSESEGNPPLLPQRQLSQVEEEKSEEIKVKPWAAPKIPKRRVKKKRDAIQLVSLPKKIPEENASSGMQGKPPERGYNKNGSPVAAANCSMTADPLIGATPLSTRRHQPNLSGYPEGRRRPDQDPAYQQPPRALEEMLIPVRQNSEQGAGSTLVPSIASNSMETKKRKKKRRKSAAPRAQRALPDEES